MKIYTKKGDKGKTSLLSGQKVEKSHLRIDAYGTSDELVSFLGLLKASITDKKIKSKLFEIQNLLFSIGSLLSIEGKSKIKINNVKGSDIILLEEEIDLMNSELPVLKNFIIPGEQKTEALCHVCRTVCRKLERKIVKLSENSFVDELILQYVNRLSDYLFVLARYILKNEGETETIKE